MLIKDLAEHISALSSMQLTELVERVQQSEGRVERYTLKSLVIEARPQTLSTPQCSLYLFI